MSDGNQKIIGQVISSEVRAEVTSAFAQCLLWTLRLSLNHIKYNPKLSDDRKELCLGM